MRNRAFFLGVIASLGCTAAPPPATLDAQIGADAGTADASGGGCTESADCADGAFCNGFEECVAGTCVAGAPPCASARCDEATDACDCAVPDTDGDGEASTACGGVDCDDGDARRYPGGREVCDVGAHDEDCDPSTFGFRDQDADGFADAACCNTDAAGAPHCGSDCDDTAPNVHPTESESCNGLDDDCDGATDEGIGTVCFLDADHDGFAPAGAAAMALCTCTDGTTPTAPGATTSDCDDHAIDVNPATAEVCGNGIDDNCDGVMDGGGSAWYPDCDGDGHGDPAGAPSMSCGPPGTRPAGCPEPSPRWAYVADDCADHDPTIRPDALDLCNGIDDDCDPTTRDGLTDPATVPETCNGSDDDCDLAVDEDFLAPRALYVDTDGDGYGTTMVTRSVPTCQTVVPGYAAVAGDCCDMDAASNPGYASGVMSFANACGSFDWNCDGILFRPPAYERATYCSSSNCAGSGSCHPPTYSAVFWCYSGSPVCGSNQWQCRCGNCGTSCASTGYDGMPRLPCF